MKNITKRLGIIALAALIAFAMAACDTDNGGNNNDGPTHFPGTLIAEDLQNSRQVWEYKKNWYRINDAHILFDEDRDVIVFVRTYDDAGSKLLEEMEAGSGKIEGGILSFSIDIPEEKFLFGWKALESSNFFYWKNAAVDPPEVRGNEFMFVTTKNERLNLEIITGTSETLSQELVRFIYVDKNCTMTGTEGVEGTIHGGGPTDTFFATDHTLDLSLKEGWNTVYRRQTFRTGEAGDVGKSLITMEIKNPLNLRWILYPAGYDGVSRPQ